MRRTLALAAYLLAASCSQHVYGAVLSAGTITNDTAESPLHIIKLKNQNQTSMSSSDGGFDPLSFIRKQYALFRMKQLSTSSSPQGGAGAGGGVVSSSGGNGVDISLDTIQIGRQYAAVIGSFDAPFTQYLHKLDAIDYVEPNRVYRVAAAVPPTTTTITGQKLLNVSSWGIARVNQREKGDLSSSTFNDNLAGEGVHVYILDTGINIHHPDLEGRAAVEANYINYEEDDDYSGHGTHVAGTVAGNTFGVAKKAQVHSVKVLDRNGDGTTVALIKAISHVSQIAREGKSIINLSLSGPRSQAIDDALATAANEHRIPIFVAAGNSADDACQYTPSANPVVFAVGASTIDDEVADYSSFGECVRLYAPGTGITSAWLGQDNHTMDGTSMANPHVTGIAALLMGHHEFNDVQELYDTLQALATKNVLKMPAAAQGVENHNLLAYTGIEALG